MRNNRSDPLSSLSKFRNIRYLQAPGKRCHTAASFKRPPPEFILIFRTFHVSSSSENSGPHQFHPFERELRSCNGRGNTTETNWNRPLILAVYGHGNFNRNYFVDSWPWLQPFSPHVVRVGVSECSGEASPSHIILNDEKWKPLKTWTGIWCGRATEHNDSGHSFQGLNKLFTNGGANYVHRTINCASMQRI